MCKLVGLPFFFFHTVLWLSGIYSIVNWDSYKDSCDFSYHPNKMAAAAVAVNSSYSYPIDVPSRYEVASSTFAGRSPSLQNLITHTDSRWPPKSHNDSTHSHASLTRLSLPSIHEALRSKYDYEEPVAPSLLPSQDRQFAPSQTPTIPRTYPLSEQSKFPSNGPQPPSQHPAHSHRHSFSRSLEPMNTSFPDTVQHPSAPAPTSQNSYKARIEANRYERELQPGDRPLSGHSHHSINTHNYDSSRTSSMPPSNQGTSFTPSDLKSREYQETFEMWRKPRDNDKPDIACKIRGGIKRNLDVWDFENNLAEVGCMFSALKKVRLIKYR